MLKRKLVSLAAGTAALLVALGSANAADLPAPASPALTSWTGPYLGLFLGVSSIDTELALSLSNSSFSVDALGGSGFLGDVRAGYDLEFDSVILGVEGSVSFDDADVKISQSDVFTTKAGRDWTINGTLRIGMVFTPETMIYGMGGISASRFKVETNWGGLIPGSISGSDVYTGFHVGGGLEHRFIDNVSLRMEYRYTNYEERNYKLGSTSLKIDPDVHEFNFGIAWRF